MTSSGSCNRAGTFVSILRVRVQVVWVHNEGREAVQERNSLYAVTQPRGPCKASGISAFATAFATIVNRSCSAVQPVSTSVSEQPVVLPRPTLHRPSAQPLQRTKSQAHAIYHRRGGWIAGKCTRIVSGQMQHAGVRRSELEIKRR